MCLLEIAEMVLGYKNCPFGAAGLRAWCPLGGCVLDPRRKPPPTGRSFPREASIAQLWAP
jgi:hypothetical protein